MEVRNKHIFVGLSGGVDSGVSAALLQKAGAQVTGVFIKGWYPPGMPCTWAEDRRDAMRVAATLGIPFRTLDAREAYKKSVIDYLLAEYRAGRTPNPDVMCNRAVKFGAFLEFAKAEGADAIATGHYRTGDKDQSYFLWAVPKEALTVTVFPVGRMEKGEVRTLAKRFGLPVAEKKDSQGVCFLGTVSVEEFLREQFGTEPGRAVDESGNEIGMHDGALVHTIGERIALSGADQGPWFVVAKHIASNELVVSRSRVQRHHDAPSSIRFAQANWHGEPREVTCAQYRYRGPYIRGRITGDQFAPEVALGETPAPGQSLVFYRGSELLGGGIIAS